MLRLRHANSHAPWDSDSAAHRAAPTGSLHSFAHAWRTWRNALGEAIGAHRRYEHLKSRGVVHDRAIRQALGIPMETLPTVRKLRAVLSPHETIAASHRPKY